LVTSHLGYLSPWLPLTSVAIQDNSVPGDAIEVHEELLEAVRNITAFLLGTGMHCANKLG